MPMQPALGQTTLKVRQHEVNLNNQRRKREPSIETDSNSLVVNPIRRQLGFSICLFLSVLNTRLYIPHSYPTMSIPGISVLFLRTGFSPGSPQCDRWQMHSKTRWLTNCNVFWEFEDSSIFLHTYILTTFPLFSDVDIAFSDFVFAFVFGLQFNSVVFLFVWAKFLNLGEDFWKLNESLAFK